MTHIPAHLEWSMVTIIATALVPLSVWFDMPEYHRQWGEVQAD